MLRDLKEIIAIESVFSEPSPNAPFGKKTREALDWFLKKADSYGMKTGELEGYCGWAEIGEGSQLIGVLCHLDVVPAGDGWTTPPFEMTVDEGRIYGRGVADDKGPMIACLHAMKSLLDDGVVLTRRIRLIVGCNEENGCECMKHYAKHGEIPLVSIVPDADFPVINSEKGILRYQLNVRKDDFFCDNVLSLSGGTKDNVVPDRAEIVVGRDSALYKKLKELSDLDESLLRTSPIVETLLSDGHDLNDFSVNDDGTKLTIAARGVAGHAMEPEKGDNAVWKIFSLLSAVCRDELRSQAAECIYENLCTLLCCEKMGFGCFDKQSGDTTCNLGTIRTEGDFIRIELNIRIPISCKKDTIADKIIMKMPSGSTIKELLYMPNLYMEKDHPLIKTLLKVYEQQTGDKADCVQSGGGTYAKELPNAVAFGPTFPGTETNIHNADESLPVEQFEKLLDIYRAALLALDRAAL